MSFRNVPMMYSVDGGGPTRQNVVTLSKTMLTGEQQSLTSVENTSDFDFTIAFLNGNLSSIDDAFVEMKDTYKERLPYVVIPTLNGNCFRWTDIFIYSCLLAMSTDMLVQFTEEEINAWWSFVGFQNYHSHSAKTTDAHGTAIGCTNPDELVPSFVVGKNDVVFDTQCQNPIFDVVNEDAWKSLDQAFIDLYNCKEIDDCDRMADMYNASDCALYTKAMVVHNNRQVVIDEHEIFVT